MLLVGDQFGEDFFLYLIRAPVPDLSYAFADRMDFPKNAEKMAEEQVHFRRCRAGRGNRGHRHGVARRALSGHNVCLDRQGRALR